MIMTPNLRKFALTIHITSSVGWIGAVVAYLVIVIAAMNSQNVQLLHGVWVALELMGWFAIVPLSSAALLTGIVMAMGTKWGLFQHYWVTLSLALTLLATVILFQHMPTVSFYAYRAATDTVNVGVLRDALQSELLHAGIGLLLLLGIQVLNVYKPRGMTPYGWRKQQEQRAASKVADAAT
jgi:hypothetical protein